MYRPSELQKTLKEIGHRPDKRLSQNFLIDRNIIEKAIQTAEILPSDHVLEIGPGLGALTEFLLPQAATVTAIEKETRFIPHLKARFPTLLLIHGDALETDYTSLSSPPTKVVANIPYNITSHLIEILFAQKIKTITLITQHDLAKRIVAVPQTKDYGPLTLLAQFYSIPKLIAKISPHCFYPEPNVDSALLHFTLQTPPLPPSDIPSFFTFCRHTFTMRRKTLRKILKIPLDSFLEKHNLSPNARPEELSLPLWIQLWDYVKK